MRMRTHISGNQSLLCLAPASSGRSNHFLMAAISTVHLRPACNSDDVDVDGFVVAALQNSCLNPASFARYLANSASSRALTRWRAAASVDASTGTGLTSVAASGLEFSANGVGDNIGFSDTLYTCAAPEFQLVPKSGNSFRPFFVFRSSGSQKTGTKDRKIPVFSKIPAKARLFATLAILYCDLRRKQL